MVKKSFALCSAVLILSLFLCIPASADSSIRVQLAEHQLDENTSITSSPHDPAIAGMFDAMIAAYGEPVKWVYGNPMTGYTGTFGFLADSVPSYWIVPRYRIQYSVDGNSTFDSATYTSSYPAVSAGDWIEVDSRTLENITNGTMNVDYEWILYKYTGWRENVTEAYMKFSSTTSYGLEFPIFLPQAFSSSGGGGGNESSEESSESGGGGGNESSEESSESGGGGGSTPEQWESLNARLDLIEIALSSINYDIRGLNETTEKVFQSVENLRDDLKTPTEHQNNEMSKAEENVNNVNSAVSQFIDDMSIPQAVFNPSVPSLPDDNGNATDVIGFVTNLYPLNIILPLGVGLWVTYLIIHGVRSS